MKAKIRKIVTFVEETHREADKTVEPATRRAAAAAVIENPFAGRYAEDLSELIEVGEELGALLTERAVAALGILWAFGGKLWQSSRGRGERRARACGGGAAPETGNAGAQSVGKRSGADTLIEKAWRHRRNARYSAGPQGRRLRAQPFRWNGNPRKRCATRK